MGIGTAGDPIIATSTELGGGWFNAEEGAGGYYC